MKLQNFFWSFLILSLLWTGCSRNKTPSPSEVRIYVYDSMMSENGLGSQIFPVFEKECGCQLKILPSGDAGQMVARFLMDVKRGAELPHLLIGIDQNLWSRVRDWSEEGGDWRPEDWDQINPQLKVADGFVPFDYAPFTFMVDQEKWKKALPQKLDDFLGDSLQKKFILEDPRSSSPGLGFLAWTFLLKKDKGADFWKKLKGRWLTMPGGWDEAYGLFLKGEAPFVWSYLTSQAYHEAHGDKAHRYQALRFEEGHLTQIEGAMLVKGMRGTEGFAQAQKLLSLLISEPIQKKIPLSNWMLPARQKIDLPPEFKNLPAVKLLPPTQAIESQALISAWEKEVF